MIAFAAVARVPAAEPGNTTAVNPNTTPNQIGMSPQNKYHGKLIPNNGVQLSGTLQGGIKNVNDSPKHVKDINTNSPKKHVKTISDKNIASSVAQLYKNHDINSITRTTGLTPGQVNKMIKDIKSGIYGLQLKNSLLKKDQVSSNGNKNLTKSLEHYMENTQLIQ